MNFCNSDGGSEEEDDDDFLDDDDDDEKLDITPVENDTKAHEIMLKINELEDNMQTVISTFEANYRLRFQPYSDIPLCWGLNTGWNERVNAPFL